MTTERDRYNQLVFAEAKGREKGFAEGVEKGMEEGAHEKALETARNLLSMGLSEEIVLKSTGLSREDIQRMADPS